jgi:hypothetical protein
MLIKLKIQSYSAIIMTMESTNKQLIDDIQNLLNRYDGLTTTSINPAFLEFMDRETLLEIITSLLKQQENINEDNIEWLQQFKTI